MYPLKLILSVFQTSVLSERCIRFIFFLIFLHIGYTPGSTQSPSLSDKPILSRAATDPTSHLSKSEYIIAEGSTPLCVIPEDIKGQMKQDIVPRVLKKPLSPETYKDYFAALLYAECYYLENTIRNGWV